MNQKSPLRSAVLAFCVVAISTIISSAQADGPRSAMQVEPSYDVSLHLLVGSNDGTRGDLPASLSSVPKQIRANFTFTNYRLAGTLLGRIANSGNFEYKSVGSFFGKDAADTSPQSFLEWTMANLRNMPTAKGQPGFQAQSFRFGIRVPVSLGSSRGDGGTSTPTFQYEAIGVSLSKVGLAENTPTLIGTLNLPGATGVIFLVMTVRSSDM